MAEIADAIQAAYNVYQTTSAAVSLTNNVRKKLKHILSHKDKTVPTAPTKKRRIGNSLTDAISDKLAKRLGYGKKSKIVLKKMGRKRYSKKRSYRRARRGRGRKRMPIKNFPGSMCVHMKSHHQFNMEPGTAADPANVMININNPIDPLRMTGSANTSLTSASEHHPKDWDIYENLYDNFEVISYKITARFFANNQTHTASYIMVPTNTKNHAEILALCNLAINGATQLAEAYKRAKVKTLTSSSSAVEHVVMTMKGNVRTQEGYNRKNQDIEHVLRGKTAANVDGEAAPSRTPAVILGMNAFRTGVDLTGTDVLVTIEQCVLFTNLSQRQGASV